MPNQPNRYLVVVRLGSTELNHVKKVVSGLDRLLPMLATESPELAFRSATADLFGYLVLSKREAWQIRTQIESPGSGFPDTDRVGPFLAGDDAVVVLELGENFSEGQGFSRVGAWLQHR